MHRLALPLAAFALAAAPAPARAVTMLKVADLQTGVVTTLASGTTAWSSLAWHADGSLTATASGRLVYAYPPGVTPLARLRQVTDAQLSPAGDRVAAESRSGRLVIRGLDGRLIGARRIRGQLTSIVWSRDGRRLAAGWFDHRLRDHITLLGRRGFALRTVSAPGEVAFSSAAWAPDGHSLAYRARPGRDRPAQIRRLDAVTGAQTVLLRGDRCSPPPLGVCELLEPPVVAPDGVHVALVRDLNWVTVLAPGARPQAFRITRQRDGVLDAAWTPDGSALVVAYAQGDDAHLAVAPLSGARHTVADLGHMDVHGLTVSADGSHAALAGTDDIDF